MNSDNEFDTFQESVAYSEGDTSEDLGETELKLREDMEDFRDMLPPPIPIMAKTFRPSEPLFQCQDIPFVLVPKFSTKEELDLFGPITDKSTFPERFPPDVTFRSIFPLSELIYLRSIALIQDGFNINTCNLKKLLVKRRARERGNERVYSNPNLTDSLSTYYKPKPGDSTLIFESRFEGGNLAMASKVNENEYNLLLQTDINSRGHTQWFYFRVQNTKAQSTVKFNLLNFPKSDSLFNHGMKVTIFSTKGSFAEASGWSRGGENIMYYPNGITKDFTQSKKTYYTLTFTYTFNFSNDTVYFAYALPYSYTSLQSLLDSYETDPQRNQYIHRKTLCRSLGGNNCDYLTITNKGTLEEIRGKRAVIISARVHPGETVGSWMMLGVLDFLTSEDPEADALRSRYIFKIVPMLNPDGVINGNYRCSLVGADLNRRWKNPLALLHPIIYNFKRLIKNTAANYDIDLICDLHGHSRKKNIFMYGCNFKNTPQTCKLFPFVLSKVSPVFSFNGSRFGVQRSKESTMRVSLFKELKIPNIYTLEASFCGADSGKYNKFHFTGEILADMGRDLCKAVLLISQNSILSRNPTLKKPLLKSTIKKPMKTDEPLTILNITKTFNIDSILKEMLDKEEILHTGEENCSSSGSDSEPSEDNLDYEDLKNLLPVVAQKKKPGVAQKKRIIFNKNIAIPRSKILPPKKKCSKCGDDELPGHVCKTVEAPPPPKKKIIGVKTYYNLAGKRVHDQATQTPISLYPKVFSRRNGSAFGPQTPDSLNELSSNLSSNEEGLMNETQNLRVPNFRIHRKATTSNSSGFLELPKKLQPLSSSLK